MKNCAFTGHRPKSFPWKYDETTQECLLLKKILAIEIEKLVENGVTEFFTGLAQGVDSWAAQIVLSLRESTPSLKLHCVLPHKMQASSWTPEAQKYHQYLQEQANTVTCLSEEYYEGCQLDRNRYMVEHASILLTVYNGGWRSGTGMTVRYAKKLGREIIIINSKTRKIEYFEK